MVIQISFLHGLAFAVWLKEPCLIYCNDLKSILETKVPPEKVSSANIQRIRNSKLKEIII